MPITPQEALERARNYLREGKSVEWVQARLKEYGLPTLEELNVLNSGGEGQAAESPPTLSRTRPLYTPSPLSALEGIIAAGQGLTFNKMDDIARMSGMEGVGQKINEIDAAAPMATQMAGRAVGSIPWALLTAGAVNPITSTPLAMAAGMGLGGLEGLLYSAGEGNQPGEPRVDPLLSVGGGIVGGPLAAVGGRVGRPVQTAEQRAAETLQGVVEASPRGQTMLDDFADVQAGRVHTTAGPRPPDGVMADIPELRPLAEGAVAAGGAESQALARRVLGPRAQGAQARGMQAIVDLAGGEINPRGVADAAARTARRVVAQEGYDNIASVMVPREARQALKRVLTKRGVQDAFTAAKEAAEVGEHVRLDRLGNPVREPARGNWRAAMRLEPTADFEALQQTYLALKARVDAGFRAGGDAATTARALRDDVLKPFEEAMNLIPGFRDAQRNYARASQVIEAVDRGGRFMQENPDEIARYLRSLGDNTEAVAAYRNSALDQMFNVPRGQVRGRNVASRFDTEGFDEKLGHLFGADSRDVRAFLDALDTEATYRGTTTALTGGSPTAPRQAVMQQLMEPDVPAPGLGDIARRVAEGLLRGGKESGTAAGLGAVSGLRRARAIELGTARGREAGNILSRALLSGDDAAVRGLLGINPVPARPSRVAPWIGLLGGISGLRGLSGVGQ